ncbi:unnamed protein product [Candida parapsilosis]
MTESLASKAPFDPRSRWNARRGRKPQDYDYYSHLNVTTTTNYANAYTPILDEVIPTTNGFISSLRDNITTIASNLQPPQPQPHNTLLKILPPPILRILQLMKTPLKLQF